MKEWVEELLVEKQQLEQQLDLMIRIISYVDQEHEDDTPITPAALQDTDPLNITMDEEGVHLNYVSTIQS